MTDPTPNLTAEAIAERKRLARICEHGRDAEIRRKAFEQAAKRARTSSYPGAPEEWNEACQFIERRIRALAKGQPSTET